MEESTAVTIEFLRARLLSERSVSRSARQRADELAKKVGELEEQLKLVTVQRQKAEKATTEVLAILENHGSADLSEMYESSSDKEEGSRESKEVADTEKEVDVESSLDPKFPSISRNLSWKSCNESPISFETAKRVDKIQNHISSVSTDGSSTRHHSGKSCRHIKQGNTRSSDAKVNDESFLLGTQENAFSSAPEEEVYFNSVQGSREDPQKETNNVSVLHGSETNAEMESALEHRAHLIGQFEAQENAQREWEEKYKVNNCNSPDSCEHGNHSDITEERDDVRVETLEAVDTIASHGQGRKAKKDQFRDNRETTTKAPPNRLREQQYINTTINHSQNTGAPGQLNREANSNETQKPEWSENNSSYSASHGSSDHQAPHVSTVHKGRSFCKGESSGNALGVAKHHENPIGLGGVLDALEEAKLLLKSQLSRQFSSVTDGTRAERTESHASTYPAWKIPGLFRVPNNSEFEALCKTNSPSYYPGSDSSRESSQPDPYLDKISSHSTHSTHRSNNDPYMDELIGGARPGIYMHPSYLDSMQRTFPNDRFSRSPSNTELGMTTNGRYSEYSGDPRQVDLYRRR